MSGRAVIVSVGPSPEHLQGLEDLLASLALYEPETRHVLIVSDGARRNLEQLSVPAGVVIDTVENPRGGRGNGHAGGLACGMLAGYARLAERAPSLILKLDTDALIIGRSFERVEAFFAANPTAGIVGSERRGARCAEMRRVVKRLMLPISLWRDPSPGHHHVVQVMFGRHRRVAWWLRRAVRAGWEPGSYCQGGAYAVSPRMLRSLAEAGALDNPLDWLRIPLSEDLVLGALGAACGFALTDLTQPGEPFACEYGELPFPADEIVARGHSVIHSLKLDPAGRSEEDLRAFFASLREAERYRRQAPPRSSRSGSDLRDLTSS